MPWSKALTFNRVFAAATLLNSIALLGLWMFGNWIIKADDLSSLNRWLLCIVVSAVIPGLSALWFVIKGQKARALCAVFAPVPLWMLLTIGLIALDVSNLKF